MAKKTLELVQQLARNANYLFCNPWQDLTGTYRVDLSSSALLGAGGGTMAGNGPETGASASRQQRQVGEQL